MVDIEKMDGSNVTFDTFRSPKAIDNLYLFMRYEMDSESEGFDPNVSEVGLIITVESGDTEMDGTLSRKDNVLAISIPYAKVPAMVINNPAVTSFEVCDEEVIKLLKESESDEVTIKAPWSGPIGDEWDSPFYHEFWGPAELYLHRKIETLEKVGKKVKVI